MPYCMFTNDVETTSIWFNSLRDDTGEKVLKVGMPILLDIYQKYNIKSTFFFTGYIAQLYPEIVKMIIEYGHEVGSHGYSHKIDEAFDVLSYDKQVEHLTKSKKILEDISGHEIISFRAPALRVNQDTPKALASVGFKIDSSVASQRFDMFLSFGGKKKLSWLTAPRLPYKTDPNDLSKRGDSSLVEVPLSAFMLPFTSTTMRIFPRITGIQKYFFNFETGFNNKPIVFDIHPNEFIDESGAPRVINRRSSNYFSYLLKDYLRGSLKVKNLGENAIPHYENLIKFFVAKNYKMTTIKQYCREENLI